VAITVRALPRVTGERLRHAVLMSSGPAVRCTVKEPKLVGVGERRLPFLACRSGAPSQPARAMPDLLY